MSYDYLLKCIIVGNSGVGKSSLLLRYVEDKFNENHELTIGVEFGAKFLNINGTQLKLQIWDTAGQESFRSITRSYYKGSCIVLLVYDMTNIDSFNSIEKWLEDILETTNSPYTILVGNKSDLLSAKVVSTDDAIKLAKKHGLTFVETSAKNSESIEDMFMTATKVILDKIQTGSITVPDDSRGIRTGYGAYTGTGTGKVKIDTLKKKRVCCAYQ